MGVEIYESSPVVEIAREKGKVRLDTPNGRVRADKVVMATNAWSHFFKELKRKTPNRRFFIFSVKIAI